MDGEKGIEKIGQADTVRASDRSRKRLPSPSNSQGRRALAISSVGSRSREKLIAQASGAVFVRYLNGDGADPCARR